MAVKIAFITMVSLCVAMTACGGSRDCAKTDRETVTMKGTVRVVGNEPFSRLVLTVPDPVRAGKPTDHVIRGSLEKEIRDRYQGKVVFVEGRHCPDGSAERFRCIEPERIVEVE